MHLLCLVSCLLPTASNDDSAPRFKSHFESKYVPRPEAVKRKRSGWRDDCLYITQNNTRSTYDSWAYRLGLHEPYVLVSPARPRRPLSKKTQTRTMRGRQEDENVVDKNVVDENVVDENVVDEKTFFPSLPITSVTFVPECSAKRLQTLFMVCLEG
jgi:hypothetical protein